MIKNIENRSSTGKKGGRKIGRNSVKCAAYRSAGRREKNKARRLEARLKRFARRAEIRKIPEFVKAHVRAVVAEELSEESMASLKRGLSQKATIYKGSFAKYAEEGND